MTSWREGWNGNGKDRVLVVRTLWSKLVYTKLEPGLKGLGFMENCALTARTEMRNCLFAPVRGRKKKCDGTIVSTSLPNSISKAVL